MFFHCRDSFLISSNLFGVYIYIYTSSSAPLRCVGRLRRQGSNTNIDFPYSRKMFISIHPFINIYLTKTPIMVSIF